MTMLNAIAGRFQGCYCLYGDNQCFAITRDRIAIFRLPAGRALAPGYYDLDWQFLAPLLADATEETTRHA